MEGLVLGRYRILRKLGEGGMGVVYEAEDLRLPRRVAIKVLGDDAASAEARARFRREARAASALNHPNIVTVHDIESTVDRDFIVMELVDGRSLHAVMAGGPLAAATAIDYATDVASALGAAHHAGIVHRDIKPGNVMVTAAGRVKILDFGLAKMAKQAEPTAQTATASLATDQGAVIGTIPYMSPEQAVGDAVDARSDVFSFGVVLYEMLAGHRPFGGDSSAAAVRAMLTERPKPLSQRRRDVPQGVQRILDRCLQKDPNARYADASEIATELVAISNATPPRVSRRTMATAAIVVLVIGTAGVTSYWSRERQARARAATLAAIDDHVGAGRLATALQLAGDLERRFAGDREVTRTIDAFTLRGDLESEPPGAEVLMRDSAEHDWVPVGTTPVAGARVPFAKVQWKISKEGFRSVEARFLWALRAAVVLKPVREAIDGMVYVQAGGATEDDAAAVPAFWIDKYEVTNREYKAFVDAGGYREQKYWREPIIRDGRTLVWADAMALFVDRTGRPGPATWEGGSYPDGQADHPVTGVSWYEAAAYAAFKGRRLPALGHHRRAAGAPNLRDDLMLGNFGGRGTERVAALRDLGPFGTYGLSGNAREWCWNPLGELRMIQGGAWNDPVYMPGRLEAKPPLDRDEANGFRTIVSEGDDRVWFTAGPAIEPRRVTTSPVSDETFEAYRLFYRYEKGPLDARAEWAEDTDLWRRERVSIAAAYGNERVPIDLLLPKGGRPPYQVVVWYPGSYSMDLTSSRAITAPMYFDFIVKSGRAVVLPVFKGFYERRLDVKRPQGLARRDLFIQRSKDLGRTIDYLESRADIDTVKLGYYVFSTVPASIPLIALEPRIKTAILLSGGLTDENVPEIAMVNFLPRIRIPLLLMAGRYDVTQPLETGQRPLFELLGTPAAEKRHFIFDGSHVPPRGLLIREMLDWLDKHLGPI